MRSEMHRSVQSYYDSHESRWGYSLLLGGRKHFGYYPAGSRCLSMNAAMDNMEKELWARLACPEGMSVLDAGSGEGRVAVNLAKRYGLRVTGLDLLERNQRAASRHAQQVGLGSQVTFEQGSYQLLPFGDASFDGAYTMETLVHSPDHMRALQELCRVLRPGGRLVCFEYTMPAESELSSEAREAFGRVIAGSSMTSMPEFRNGSFEDEFVRAGFENVIVDDLSQAIEPMLRLFDRLGRLPYLLAKTARQDHHFVNAMAGVEFFRYRSLWRYVAVCATKPE